MRGIQKKDIDALIANAGINLTERECQVFVEEITPKLQAWEEEYRMVPYALVHALLDGFVIGAKVATET